jgi:hypothetical protein
MRADLQTVNTQANKRPAEETAPHVVRHHAFRVERQFRRVGVVEREKKRTPQRAALIQHPNGSVRKNQAAF